MVFNTKNQIFEEKKVKMLEHIDQVHNRDFL